MASKYTQVATIWFGKKSENGDQQPHSIKFIEGFVPNPEAWYQFQSKKFKEQDLDQKIAKGWIKPEQAEKARYSISKMSDKVIAEIIEVLKTE